VVSFHLAFPPNLICIQLLPMRAIFPAHLTLLDLIILITFGKECRLWSSSLRNFFQPPAISPIFGPNIVLPWLANYMPRREPNRKWRKDPVRSAIPVEVMYKRQSVEESEKSARKARFQIPNYSLISHLTLRNIFNWRNIMNVLESNGFFFWNNVVKACTTCSDINKLFILATRWIYGFSKISE
jgi:hypothetical protein